jgi:hypothetical protein
MNSTNTTVRVVFKGDQIASIMFVILAHRDVLSQTLPFGDEETQRMTDEETSTIPESIPMFFRDLIHNGWPPARSERHEFGHILEVIEENGIEFTEGVDICEAFEWLKSVEGMSIE